MLRLLRSRDFGPLFGGALVSQAGDYVLLVALPFWIFRLTGSAAATGVMFAAMVLPQLLLSPVAGVFVDRWDRKTTMIASDLLRAGIVAALFTVRSADQVWVVYVLALAESCASRFFLPARSAVLPLIVPAERLAEANAALGVAEAVARLGGPALGGVLVAVWGPHGAAFVDACSYLASAAAIALVRVPRSLRMDDDGHTATVAGVWRDLREGAAVVLRRPVLRGVFAVVGVFMLSEGIIEVLLVVMVSRIWGGDAADLGIILSAQGIGAIVGGVCISGLAGRIGLRPVMVLGGVCCGLLLLVIVNQPSMWVATALIAPAGLFVVGLFVGAETLVQTGSDDHNRGRVRALLTTVTAASTLISMGLAGALADTLGVTSLLDLAGAAMILSGLLALVVPVHAPNRREAVPEPVA